MQTLHHQQFVQLHQASQGVLLLPNAWDAASAKIFEASGAKAVATSSASWLGPAAMPMAAPCRRTNCWTRSRASPAS